MLEAQLEAVSSPEYGQLKTKLHTRLVEEIDLESLNRLDEETARERARQVIRERLQRENTPLTHSEREQMGWRNSRRAVRAWAD